MGVNEDGSRHDTMRVLQPLHIKGMGDVAGLSYLQLGVFSVLLHVGHKSSLDASTEMIGGALDV